jgi:hypothetical protein
MIIPNADNAVVDIRKLRDYCLNSEHDDGKHKARLFSSSLGMTADNARNYAKSCLKSFNLTKLNWGEKMSLGSATH